MEETMIIITDSHAYPGCLVLTDQDVIAGPTHVQFGDGIVVEARIDSMSPEQIVLTINSYVTARGTAVGEKSWLLQSVGSHRLRVKQRCDLTK
jgi:hypothetical protein